MCDAVLSETVTITGYGSDVIEAYSAAAGKTCKFRTYEGAGHGFLQVDSSRYHAESAVDAWREILDWFGRYLAA